MAKLIVFVCAFCAFLLLAVCEPTSEENYMAVLLSTKLGALACALLVRRLWITNN